MSGILSIEVGGGVGGLGLGVNASPSNRHEINLDEIKDEKLLARIRAAFSDKTLSALEKKPTDDTIYDGMTYKISTGQDHVYELDDAALSDEQKDLIDILIHDESLKSK